VSVAEDIGGPPPVRVVVVDDLADVRLLLRLQFARDERFDVVGEGADGLEAISLADRLRPDLMVLDRQMPKLGGVEAIPEIRRRSPETGIILYTAQSDAGTQQAALAAGALDVFDKSAGLAMGFVDHLVGVLVARGDDPAATVDVRVGPVSAAAARVWVANTKTIIDAVAAHPEVLEQPVPPDVLELFSSFLDQWGAVARDADEFRWAARARPDDVFRIVTHWADIDRLSDGDLRRLGIHWSPPEGEPFFHALTSGVLDALRRHDETRRLAARLGDQWAQ
jgi:CheY-like chemotaxis protein